MTDTGSIEGRSGVARVEAFSDGVLAIIITIMVLELKAPEEGGIEELLHLWPLFLAYILSYAYIAIYWINHHRLFSHARVVTGSLLWANILLLFALSLVPFSTAYLGLHNFDRVPTMIYTASLLLPSAAYTWLQSVIRRTGSQERQAQTYHLATSRKGIAATLIYLLGMGLSAFWPVAGIICAALVAVFWMLPWGPLDRLFLRCDGPDGQ